jgi:hypothetical protein
MFQLRSSRPRILRSERFVRLGFLISSLFSMALKGPNPTLSAGITYLVSRR